MNVGGQIEKSLSVPLRMSLNDSEAQLQVWLVAQHFSTVSCKTNIPVPSFDLACNSFFDSNFCNASLKKLGPRKLAESSYLERRELMVPCYYPFAVPDLGPLLFNVFIKINSVLMTHNPMFGDSLIFAECPPCQSDQENILVPYKHQILVC